MPFRGWEWLRRWSDAGGGAAYSQAFQELEDRVGWPVSAGWCVGWCGSCEGLFLEVEVGVEVGAVGGSDVLVSEPECDCGGVHAVSSQFHRAAVPEGVGCDVLGRQ